MSISSIVTYYGISINDGSKILFSMEDVVGGDYVAGMLLSLILLFNKYTINIKLQNDVLAVNLENPNPEILENYLILEKIPYNDLTNDNVINTSYLWWIYNSPGFFDLYSFDSMDFVSGFLEGFRLVKKDFRDYIAGLIFKINPYTEFLISGYDIQRYDPIYDYPDEEGAYYAGSYQADAVNYE